MTARTWVLAVVAVVAAPGAARAQLAQTGKVCSIDAMACRYWEPIGYDAGKSYPLILYLHGAGSSGNDNVGPVDFWDSMPPAMLDMAVRTKHPAFFVAPQAPAPEGNDRWVNWDWAKGSYDVDAVAESASMKKALSIVAMLRARYNVDADRIYVMGESMGGFGTWDAISRHPDLFAAGVPTDGGGSPKAASRLRNMAILSAHFGADGSVPVSSDREMFHAVAAAGGRPTYIEVGKDAHGVAGVFCADPAFHDWLFAQRRGVAPSAPFPRLAFTPSGGGVAARASVAISTDVASTADVTVAIRYTLDGSVPTPTTGMAYSAPFAIDRAMTVTALVYFGDDDGPLSVFHAATYTPGGAPDPIAGGTGSGGAATGGTGGFAGRGGSPLAGAGQAGSSGGAAAGASGGAAAGASGGAAAGATGGVEAGANSGRGDSAGHGGAAASSAGSSGSGCSFAPRPTPIPQGFVVAVLLALRHRRRTSSRRPPSA